MKKIKNRKEKEAVLLLDDGRLFRGIVLGASGDAIGEVCFNTGMTGYQEILTDPSYAKQMVTMTAPHIGNYGINSEDVESEKIQVSGFIIKEESYLPSSWRSEMSLSEYLKSIITLFLRLKLLKILLKDFQGYGLSFYRY